jgi:hypothetical protein
MPVSKIPGAGISGGSVTVNQTAPDNSLVIDSSGNVGIGTSTVASGRKLQVEASGDTIQRINSGGASSGLSVEFANNGTLRGGIGNGSGNISGGSATTLAIQAVNEMVFASGGYTERMRIDSSGNLLVGTTTTTQSHRIVGKTSGGWNTQFYSTFATADQNYGIQIYYTAAAPNGSSSQFIQCLDNASGGTNRFQVKSNGGIDNYSANNSNLSDAREKTNIQLAGSYLDKICAIPVKTFNYIDQNIETDNGLTLGVVAQDVQSVAPELVMESDWGTKEEPKMRLSIYQTDLQYALMKSIQELKAELDATKAEVQALKEAK